VATIAAASATSDVPDRHARADALVAKLDATPPPVPGGDDLGATATSAVNSVAAEFEPFVRTAVSAAQIQFRRTMTALGDDPGSHDDRERLAGATARLASAQYDDAARINALSVELADAGQHYDEIRRRHGLAVAAEADEAPAAAETAAALFAMEDAHASVAVAAQADAAETTPVAAPQAAEPPTAFEAPSAIGWIALFVSGLLRFVILAVVLSLLGYFIFRDGFQGTWSQMINIFVWAFFTDVALSTVKTLQGRLPGAPAQTTT
jgi:hypothetical protein